MQLTVNKIYKTSTQILLQQLQGKAIKNKATQESTNITNNQTINRKGSKNQTHHKIKQTTKTIKQENPPIKVIIVMKKK